MTTTTTTAKPARMEHSRVPIAPSEPQESRGPRRQIIKVGRSLDGLKVPCSLGGRVFSMWSGKLWRT